MKDAVVFRLFAQEIKSKSEDNLEISEALRLRNMEWILERMKSEPPMLPLYTMDIETDPFARGKVPVPFVIGLYDGLTFWHFKTDKKSSCIEKVKTFLEDETIDPGLIYMHNGGRFDFFYLMDFFEGRTTIINARIVSALMPIGMDKSKRSSSFFEFRDSYAIMPFPLAAYQKDKIEIQWLSRQLRDAHMGEIISYLKSDCMYLWDLCVGFQREFGDHKTIASAAFAELSKFHKYEALPWRMDKELREHYYFGGRVQCFQKGIIEQDVSIYDVNSMYPFVMKSFYHPVGWSTTVDKKIHGWDIETGISTKEKLKTFFLTVSGWNEGAFPTRLKDGSVDFTENFGVFHPTIHEYITAHQLGLFKTHSIQEAHSFLDYSKFDQFVDHFYKAREKAKVDGDKMHSLFYKFILNSAYGKFGINPANYFNWRITKTDSERPKGEGWTLENISHARYFIWKQPSQLFWNVKNIATAASITGAARSMLLRAIARSESVLYCDTDSILCKSFGNDPMLRIDDKVLGAWKAEGHGNLAAIAGKKMYAVFDTTDTNDDRPEGLCIKHACKGVDLTPEQIKRVCQGEEIITFRDAPTFQRDGSAKFIERTARMT